MSFITGDPFDQSNETFFDNHISWKEKKGFDDKLITKLCTVEPVLNSDLHNTKNWFQDQYRLMQAKRIAE